MLERIPLPNPDLSKQKMLETKVFELVLTDDRFTITMKFRAEEPQRDDESLPWIEVDNDYEAILPKANFSGMEKM